MRIFGWKSEPGFSYHKDILNLYLFSPNPNFQNLSIYAKVYYIKFIEDVPYTGFLALSPTQPAPC